MPCSISRALRHPDSPSLINTQWSYCARLHATKQMGLSGTIGGERRREGEEEDKQAGYSEHSKLSLASACSKQKYNITTMDAPPNIFLSSSSVWVNGSSNEPNFPNETISKSALSRPTASKVAAIHEKSRSLFAFISFTSTGQRTLLGG